MKNYDLGQYMLQTDKIVMFPITKEEIEILRKGKDDFEKHFRMPYIASDLKTEAFEQLDILDMEDDYWFMQSLWIVVDIKAREIFGTLRYKNENDQNKIIANLTMLSDFPEACNEALNLFAKFLTVNNYTNIAVEMEKITY